MKAILKTHVNIKKYLAIIFSFLIFSGAIAQQDTTKVELGNKKIIIIEGKTYKKQAIENLEKGIETFKSEIEISKLEINKHNATLDSLNSQLEAFPDNTEIEKKLKKQEKLIEAENKKIEAFEKGINEIEEGIAKIEKELKNIPKFENSEDTIIIHNDENKKHHHKKKYEGHWAGFEMGIANFRTTTNAIAKDEQTDFMKLNPEKSFTYNVNIFEYNIPLIKKFAGITTGAGVQWNSYSLYQNVNIVEDANNVLQANYIDPTIIDFKRNYLNMAYLTIPAILEIQIPLGKERFYISGGATGSLRMWSKQKQKYIENGVKMKNKVADDFQLTPFRYGATFRIGYGDIGLFANYKFTPLFNKNHGPELYPFTIGISIISF